MIREDTLATSTLVCFLYWLSPLHGQEKGGRNGEGRKEAMVL